MKHSAFSAIALLMFCSTAALAQTTAVTGATIHTVGPDGTLENATILIERTTITQVGTNISIPAGAEVIEANGSIITPGLFSPIGQLGLTEVSAVQETNDATQRGKEFTASFEVADAYNPRSTSVAVSRADGITRAAITPRAASADAEGNHSSVLSGLGSIVSLGGGTEHIVKRGAAVVVNVGETGSGIAGGSRANAIMTLRAALDDAQNYRDNKAAADRGDWRQYRNSLADLTVLQNVLDQTTPLLFNVNRASDISVVLDLAAEYEIRAIIAGGAEAWMVADEIAAAGVPVILDGINNLPGSFDRLNARLDSASLLAAAGVRMAFEAGSLGPGGQTHNARNITQAAGIAVANGMAWDEALEAVTLIPAQIYGVDDLSGSLEAGKEADLVLWSGDPLEISSYPTRVFIKGSEVSLVNRHTLLRDRYLQTDSELPPAFRQ